MDADELKAAPEPELPASRDDEPKVAPLDLLTPRDVAQRFQVDPKTVSRWARNGLLSSVWTPGGHRRYARAEVEWMATGGDPRWHASPWCPVSPEPHPREEGCRTTTPDKE